jgi:hypothetical protein
VTQKKRKFTPKKPSARMRMHANKPQLEATLIDDKISLVHGAIEDASKDTLQRYEEKHVELYKNIERELKEVQQVVRLVCSMPIVSSTPSSSQTVDLEDEPTPQGEPGIWFTLPKYSIKFPTPAALQANPNLDVDFNLIGIPPGQVKVLEVVLKAYRREQR